MICRRACVLVVVALSTLTVGAAQAPDPAVVEALGSIYRLRDYTAFDWISGAMSYSPAV